MPRIYIAGPMTGLPESNYPAFYVASAAWRTAGWDVENPAEHFGGAQDRRYVDYVNADIVALQNCDAIAMLPNWDAGHSGAIWEHAIASHLLKIPVYDATKPAVPEMRTASNYVEDQRPGICAACGLPKAFHAWTGVCPKNDKVSPAVQDFLFAAIPAGQTV